MRPNFSRIAFAIISFSFFASSAFAKVNFKYHPSMPAPLKAIVEDTLKRMGEITLSQTSPLHREFFGHGETGEVYHRYLGQIKVMGYHKLGRKGPLAAVSGFQPQVLVFFENFYEAEPSFITSVATIIHEAAHIGVKARNGHVLCPKNDLDGEELVGHISGIKLVGKPGCDSKYNGGYGIMIVALNNISRYCTNCSDGDREEAHELAGLMLKRIVKPSAHQKLLADWKSSE